jgi:hypothetical protein
MNDEYEGIEVTSAGRCSAVLNVEGEHFQCDYGINHQGWAHSSRSAQAIWKGTEDES